MPSQVTGASQTALNVYQALYGQAPSNPLLADYKSTITTSGAAAFASQMTAGFAQTKSASLASTVLTNLGVYSDSLSAALTQMFEGYGVASRGQIILNLTSLLSNLEGDVTYGAAAVAYNAKIGNNFTYASNTANTTPGVYTAPVAPVVLDPTYSITTSSASVNEGDSAVFTITTKNVAAGTVLSYTLSGVSSADVVGGSLTGTATVDATGRAVISVPIAADMLTEGAETMTLTAAGKTASVIVNDTSTTPAPVVPPVATYALASSVTSVNEGSSVIYTVTTKNVAAGSVLSYTITGDVLARDITGGQITGTATVGADGTAVFAVGLVADQITDGDERMIITVAGQTNTVTVRDTSQAPVVVPPATATYTVSNNNTASVNEGGTATFVIKATNVAPGSTVAYTLAGTGNATNLTGAGSATVDTGGNAVVTVAVPANTVLGDSGTLALTILNGGATAQVITRDVSVATPTNIPLTTGPDTLGSATAPAQQNFVGTTADSFSAFDTLTGVTGGTDTLSANITATTLPSAITVRNIPTVNLTTSGAGFTADVTTSSWTGLTSFSTSTSNAAGTPVNITAPSTVSVIASNAGAVGGSMTITGGNNVSTTQGLGTTGGNLTISREVGAVTVNDAQLGNTISVVGGTAITINATNQTGQGTSSITVGGNTTAAPAPTGAVSITATSAFPDNTSASQGPITVFGGTTVTVNETTAQAATVAVDGTGTFTSGAVNVNGTALTTAVTVNQTAAVTAANVLRAANPGATGVTAITAATGVQGVTLVTGVTGLSALARASGIVDGVVSIVDAGTTQTSAGTITSVTLNNYANSTIADNALATLNLGGTAGTLSITNNNTAQIAARANTLAINFNGPTGLTAITTGGVASNAITDVNNEISTLNINTGIVSSTLTNFVDSNLTTINVTSTGATANRLTMSNIPASLTSLNVTGTAGFADGASTATGGLSALGAGLTIVDSSSGVFNAALNDTTQTFTNTGTGANTIIVSSLQNATRTITAGSGTTDELRLEGGAYALTSASAGRFVGFETLGVAANVTGTIDVSAILPGITGLNVPSASTTLTYTRVPTNARVTIGGASDTLVVGYIDSAGPSDVVPVTLSGVGASRLTFADANGTGIGTLNVTSNVSSTQFTATGNNVIADLVDNGLSTLNVSGTSGLTITLLNQSTTPATSFTLGNTSTSGAGVTIGTFTDASLNTLNFTGSGASSINALNTSSPSLTITNAAGGLNTIGTLTDNSLTSLTLGANVMLGNAAAINSTLGLQDNNTTGITISGAADNAHVTVNLAGAAAGRADAITLGNGNNYVVDGSTAGTVTVTVGTGANFIQLGAANGNTTGTYTVNLGARGNSLWNQVMVGSGGSTFNSAPNYIITGANNGDAIGFLADTNSASTITTVSLASATTVAGAIALLQGTAGINGVAGRVATGVFGGNTYVVESASGVVGAADTTVIQINGTPTLTAGTGGITIGATAASPFAGSTVANSFQLNAGAANAITLAAGSNTVTFNALTVTGNFTTAVTSVAGTGNVVIADNASGLATAVTGTTTFTFTGSTGAGGAGSTDATGLTINNASTANVGANGTGTVLTNTAGLVAPNLTSLTLNTNGTVAGSTINLTSVTANALQTITVGGASNAASNVTIPTLSSTFAGGLTININSATLGATTIGNTATTLSASSLTINDTSTGGASGALAFGATGMTPTNLATMTINQSGTGTGAISVTTFTSPLNTLNISGTGAKTLTLTGITTTASGTGASGAFTANYSGSTAVTVTAFATTSATSFNINDSATAPLIWPTFTDNALVSATLNNTGPALLSVAAGGLVNTAASVFSSLTLSGSGNGGITLPALTLAGNLAGNVTVTDTYAGTATITTIAEAAVTTGSMTVTNSGNGNLAIGTLNLNAAQTGAIAINNTGTGVVQIGTLTNVTTTAGSITLNAAGGSIFLPAAGVALVDNSATSFSVTGNVTGLTSFTTTRAGSFSFTETGPNPNALTVVNTQATLTANHTFTNQNVTGSTGAGNAALTIDVNASNSTAGSVFTNTVTFASGHTAVDTVIVRGAATVSTTATAAVPATGYVVINDSSPTLTAANLQIQLSAGGLALAANGGALGALSSANSTVTGAQGAWVQGNTGLGTVFLETGTFLQFTPGTTTWQQVATAIGNVTNTGAAKGVAVIQTAAGSGVYDVFGVTLAATHAGPLVAGADGIQLIGIVNVAPGQALVAGSFSLVA